MRRVGWGSRKRVVSFWRGVEPLEGFDCADGGGGGVVVVVAVVAATAAGDWVWGMRLVLVGVGGVWFGLVWYGMG